MIQKMGALISHKETSKGVREEHIDVILCEEAFLDPNFGAWLATQMGVENAKVVDSVSSFWCGQPRRESDIIILFEAPSGHRTVVHIENKICSRLDDKQVEGYQQGAKHHAEQIGAHAWLTAIVAPQGYLNWQLTVEGFDHRISYEKMAKQIDGPAPRQKLRAQVLRAGIEKFRGLGITEFTDNYLEIRKNRLDVFRHETANKPPTFVLDPEKRGHAALIKLKHQVAELQIPLPKRGAEIVRKRFKIPENDESNIDGVAILVDTTPKIMLRPTPKTKGQGSGSLPIEKIFSLCNLHMQLAWHDAGYNLTNHELKRLRAQELIDTEGTATTKGQRWLKQWEVVCAHYDLITPSPITVPTAKPETRPAYRKMDALKIATLLGRPRRASEIANALEGRWILPSILECINAMDGDLTENKAGLLTLKR